MEEKLLSLEKIIAIRMNERYFAVDWLIQTPFNITGNTSCTCLFWHEKKKK